MRYLKIISLLIVLLTVSACNVQNKAFENNTKPSKENYILEKNLSFDKSFSISFWVKPLDNYSDSLVLEMKDDNNSIRLINNSNNNDIFTGVKLTNDNNLDLHSGFILETYNYNFISIGFENNNFYLYVNGNYIDDILYKSDIDIKGLKMKIGSNEFDGAFKNLVIDDCKLSKEKIDEMYYKDLVLRLDNIDYDNSFKNNARGKVKLPISNLDVFYECGNNTKIEKGYLIFDDNKNEYDIKTKLKVNYSENNHKVVKELDFIIRGNNKQNKLEEVANIINNQLNGVISESNIFKEDINDCKIEYEVIKGNAKYIDNHFIKMNDNEKEKVTIKSIITIENDMKIVEKEVVLLDEFQAYLLVYFDGDDGWPDHKTGSETIYLAISKDLNNWQKLNNKPIVKTKYGSGRLRDPYANRDKDGNFIITATEAYDNPGMYIIKTDDFLKFDLTHINFNAVDESFGLSGKRAWAPEYVYNQDKDVYSILFSDPSDINKSIYAVDTKDFVNYSYPYSYFNAGYNVIDANITMLDNQWYLFYKDEDTGDIHYAISDCISNPTWRIYDETIINDGFRAEGPFILNDHINNNFRFYIDSYKESCIYSTSIYKWTDTVDIYPNIDEGLTNLGGVRHFSIVELTSKEYERIINYYD